MVKAKKKPEKSKSKTKSNKKTQKNLWQRIRPQKREYDKVLTFWLATKETLKFIKTSWKKLGGIALIYLILYLLFVKGSEKFNLDEINQSLDEVLGANGNKIIRSATLVGVTLGSQSQNSESSSVYGMFLSVIFILALIWGVRRLNNKDKFKIRDAFYFGVQPIIPFILVTTVIAAQLIPFALGSFLYETVKQNAIVAYFWEESIFLGIWLIGALLSAYWLAVSVNALFVVSLPNMYPLQALKEAKQLVRYRRWIVFRRMIAFPIAVAIVGLIILIITAYLAPSLTVWIFEILKAFGIVAIIVYLYKIYRSMV